MRPNAVVWLVRDTCRLDDNPALRKACEIACESQGCLIALACLEPRRWAEQYMRLPRVSQHWMSFRAESLRDLRSNLEDEGSALWISAQEPAYAVLQLSQTFSIVCVVTDEPLATEERLENVKLSSEGFYVIPVTTDDLFEIEQLPFGFDSLPATFSKFRRSVEKKPALVPPLCVTRPKIPGLTEAAWTDPVKFVATLSSLKPTAMDVPLAGGTDSALVHWSGYLEARALSHYKATRNSFSGLHQSSHLSAWLAHGCLSARQIWHDTLLYEETQGSNESTYWLRFELLWREYFRWYSRARDWTLFRFTGPEDRLISGDQNATRFAAWSAGVTGCDIVDAGIRELNATGWVSNRARQLMASHLIYELNLDWRLGASYFESRLIDHDVASNWGNWAYIAGVGPDPRGGRVFNFENQADRYDVDGRYRAFWLEQ